MTAFKSYDVRGVYPTEVNENLLERVGRAFVVRYRLKKVFVGRDCRNSSHTLAKAFMKGVLEQGATVVDMGLCSTPMAYVATKHGAVAMITASHLGKQYNGVKLVLKNLEHVGDLQGIKSMVERQEFPSAKQGTKLKKSVLKEYVAAVAKQGKKSKKHIVIDCGNGMAGLTAKAIFPSLCEPTFLFSTLDGNFPNRDPNPLIDPLSVLSREVKKGALFGVAYDSDCDRLFLVDEKGNKVAGDMTYLLLALSIAKKGDTVVLTPNLSKTVEETLHDKGIKTHYTQIGHVFVKQAMKQTNAVFGGELSGHYYFKSLNGADSADLAIIHLLNRIDKPVSHLVKPFLVYEKSEEINFDVEDKTEAMRAVQNYFGCKEGEFGIWYKAASYWFLIRKSGTEDVLRFVAEASTKEELDRIVQSVKSLVRG